MERMESQKRNKETFDRISYLPEPILHHILSFLSTKDALKTSFLSKSWSNLWTSIRILDFDEFTFYNKDVMFYYHGELGDEEDDDKIKWELKKQFADLIDRSLLPLEGQNIRELNINFDHIDDSILMTRVDPWVRFALTNVSLFRLDFSCGEPLEYCPENMYQLPPCSFPSKFLKVMELSCCQFMALEHNISFPCLETVILNQVQLYDTSVTDLIANSPHLESLYLESCWFSTHFIIDAPQSQLKYLVLDSNDVDEQCHISVPSLLHIQFFGVMPSNISVENLSNLIDARLEFRYSVYSIYGGMLEMLCELLNAMDHAKTLTLSNFCLQILSLLEAGVAELREYLPSPLYNLKHLTVKTDLNNYALVGLACLLRISPNLEAFSIEFSYDNVRLVFGDDLFSEEYKHISKLDDSEFWESQLLLFPCLSHLEKVEINKFGGQKFEMGLVKYLLQKSFLLKEMVIIHDKCNNDELEFLKELFKSRVCNTSAVM
ncbi:hypothetical protein NE237_032396 [Protea cynaroides]|uniref:F-box domain-containing protein n=1 Tax=Protea cynaroides TaxID=273540 RepID=A0A9Q0L399_9MAGN|nr:hypothetical protein NE237_032396 [Protea cynaroides]